MRLILVLSCIALMLSVAVADTAKQVIPPKDTQASESAPRTPAKAIQVAPVAPAAPASQPQPPKPADTMISMSFDKADVGGVIKFLSTTSGIPIVYDPELKGSITIVSQKDIPLSDAFEVVNAALRVRGYAMVGTLES